jgi:hypothetical protein
MKKKKEKNAGGCGMRTGGRVLSGKYREEGRVYRKKSSGISDKIPERTTYRTYK